MNRLPIETAKEIRAEIARAVKLHGEQVKLPDSVWCCIATEEIGEIAQGLLKEGFGRGSRGWAEQEKMAKHTDEEIVQLASVLIHWLTIRRARKGKR